MIQIKEYNISTGHVEVLMIVEGDAAVQALQWADAFNDRSTDHVVFISKGEDDDTA